jgi:hypothetical protein
MIRRIKINLLGQKTENEQATEGICVLSIPEHARRKVGV